MSRCMRVGSAISWKQLSNVGTFFHVVKKQENQYICQNSVFSMLTHFTLQ